MTDKLIIAVDIDNTVCDTVDGDYENAKPNYDMIDLINYYHSLGHTIVMYTARGATTGLDWHAFTKAQLESWGLKFHELDCSKRHFDVLIDDKAIHPEALLAQVNEGRN